MKKIRYNMYIEYLDIVDWFLLLFMAILMTQTIYNLFFNEAVGNTSSIDTAIRTTTAGLFGYYIGKGFMQGVNKTKAKKKQKIVIIPEDLSEKSKNALKNTDTFDKKDSDELIGRKNIQVIIVGTLGIVSLIILVITRNTNISTVGNVATISQLRDFVSGSTGFLISQSKK